MGVVGIVDDVTKVVGSSFLREGRAVLLLDASGAERTSEAGTVFGSSEYARVVLGKLWGRPPAIDLDGELRLQQLLDSARGRESRSTPPKIFPRAGWRLRWPRSVSRTEWERDIDLQQWKTRPHPGPVRRNTVAGAGFLRPGSRRQNPRSSETARNSGSASGHDCRRQLEDQHRWRACCFRGGCRVEAGVDVGSGVCLACR